MQGGAVDQVFDFVGDAHHEHRAIHGIVAADVRHVCLVAGALARWLLLRQRVGRFEPPEIVRMHALHLAP